MLVSFFYILRANYRRDFDIPQHSEENAGKIEIKLAESVTFLHKGRILRRLSEIPDGAQVHIDGSDTQYIDLEILEVIHNFKETASGKNIRLELTQIPSLTGNAAH
jgi:SulP family sulfate permease